jgi:hypothetical protein
MIEWLLHQMNMAYLVLVAVGHGFQAYLVEDSDAPSSKCLQSLWFLLDKPQLSYFVILP